MAFRTFERRVEVEKEEAWRMKMAKMRDEKEVCERQMQEARGDRVAAAAAAERWRGKAEGGEMSRNEMETRLRDRSLNLGEQRDERRGDGGR